jgi:hypothetical protein
VVVVTGYEAAYAASYIVTAFLAGLWLGVVVVTLRSLWRPML